MTDTPAASWRDVRAVEGTGLENRRRASVRGFESLLLRHKKPWNRNGSRVLLYPLVGIFPLVFPLQLQNVLDEALHALCAGPFHLVRNMAVHIQSKGCCGMAQVSLHRLDIVPRSD